MDRREAPAGSAERRDRRAPAVAPAERRSRKPAALGFVFALGAMGAWLLRRERPRPPEGTWRDLLSSDPPRGRGDAR
jgi:hypothetical protein